LEAKDPASVTTLARACRDQQALKVTEQRIVLTVLQHRRHRMLEISVSNILFTAVMTCDAAE